MGTATPPDGLDFHALLRWHLEHGTRPHKTYDPDWRWTQEAFADAAGANNRETVTSWVGRKLPNLIKPLLEALFGDDPAHAAARRRLEENWKAARSERVGVGRKLRDRKLTWPAEDWRPSEDPAAAAVLVPAGESDEEDARAAAAPILRQRLPSCVRKLDALADVARALHNMSPDYDALHDGAQALKAILARGLPDLLAELGAAYEAMLTLGTYVESDNRRRATDPPDAEALDDPKRRTLDDAYKSLAGWLAAFPSIREQDAQLGGMLLRRDLLAPARAVARAAVAAKLVSASDGKRVEDQIDAADRGDFQGAKAGTRGIGTVKAMLLRGAEEAAHSVEDGRNDASETAAERFGQTIERAPSDAEQVIGDLPSEESLAVASVAEALSGQRMRTWRPPLTPLAGWREPVPGLPEAAWPDMVTLPAGVFTMGASATEQGSAKDERPQREVTVRRPLALGRTAVTFAMWDAARAAGADLPHPPDRDWGRDQRPVINVSWEDAQAYCAWLNQRLGLRAGTYRLPSEAEWEYACRAGTVTAFSFRDGITKKQVNHFDGRGDRLKGRTVPVGSLPANPWGLREMHGNVWEWIEDAFGPYPDHATDSRPLIHAGSSLRVLRGGSWYYYPSNCRSAFRGRVGPGERGGDVGFRLARTLF